MSLQHLPLLVAAGADANRKFWGELSPLGQLMSERAKGRNPVSLPDFTKVAKVLQDHGMKIDNPDDEVLVQAAWHCDLGLVKTLLQLGANPANPDVEDDPVQVANKKCDNKAELIEKALSEAQKSGTDSDKAAV